MRGMFPESDWKLYRKKISDWQEGYMDRLCHEYVELLQSDSNPSDRFWKLEERIKDDKKKSGVQVRMSRSEMLYDILSLINEGAITKDDLEGFSEDLRDTVEAYTNRRFLDEQDQ